MRTKGSPVELEYRRILAVQRLVEGYTVDEVADFLDIDDSSVRRWRAQFQTGGWPALLARPVPGRPPFLTCTQEKIVRRWLSKPATEQGFTTDLWTAPRLVTLIAEAFEILFHPDYLGVWMRERGYSPQQPQRRAREHDAQQVAAWLHHDWPRIKKKRLASMRRWPGWMRVD